MPCVLLRHEFLGRDLVCCAVSVAVQDRRQGPQHVDGKQPAGGSSELDRVNLFYPTTTVGRERQGTERSHVAVSRNHIASTTKRHADTRRMLHPVRVGVGHRSVAGCQHRRNVIDQDRDYADTIRISRKRGIVGEVLLVCTITINQRIDPEQVVQHPIGCQLGRPACDRRKRHTLQVTMFAGIDRWKPDRVVACSDVGIELPGHTDSSVVGGLTRRERPILPPGVPRRSISALVETLDVIPPIFVGGDRVTQVADWHRLSPRLHRQDESGTEGLVLPQ